MKKLSVSIVVTLFCACIAYGAPGNGTHVLNVKRTLSCEIVVTDDAGPVAAFAGKELKELLSQSLSADVPIVKKPDEKKTSIILGNNQYLKNAGIDISKLPRDGFIIKSSGNNIFIAGIDSMDANPEKGLKGGIWGLYFERGTLFGVYDFLERYAGIRFYFPGKIGTVIPKHETLKLEAMNITEKPDYTVRKFSSFSGMLPDGRDGKDSWSFKNMNYYRLRLETRYIPNCHGLGRLGYVERFGESHPEYFALMQNGKRYVSPTLQHTGQLCYSSGIKDEIYKDAEAFLTGKPASSRNIMSKYGCIWDQSGFQTGYFNIMPQDGMYLCRCPECQKHFSKGPKATSEFMWDFVCDTAEKLKKNNIPGYITMMAYSPYREVPDREIPSHVLVMLAEAGPWIMHIPEVYKKEVDEIKVWYNKQKRKIWLWNYTNKYGKREILGVPDVTPKCIGKYYKEQAPYIFGAYMESETDKYIFHYLDYYVFSKVCWNNSSDVDKILKEHYQKMFGAAAGTMEKIYERFEENWLKVIGKPIETPLGPASVPVSDYELWEKIYSQDEIDSLDKRFGEAEKLTASSQEENERVRFMRENMFKPLKDARELYLKNKKEISDLNFYSPSTDAPVSVDGTLDEKVWNESEKVFLRPFGKDSGKNDRALKTIVRAIHDKDNLYISFECEEPEMAIVSSSERKADDKEIWKDPSVEVFLNPSGDRKKYYQLMINASGSLSDLSAEKVGASQTHDWAWNSGATVAVKKNKGSWIAEIAVPIKNLPGFNPDGFPVNFNRNRILLKKDGDYVKLFTWSPFLRHGFHELENFGSIRFQKKNDGNIVNNGDFTAEVKDRYAGKWAGPQKNDIKNGESWAIVSDEFINGGKSLMLKCPEKGSVCLTQYLPEMKANTEYLLTFFLKTEDVVPLERGASGVCVNINYDKNLWFPANFYTGAVPWTKQGFKFKTAEKDPNNKNPGYIRLRIMNAKGTAWFDDVKIVPVTE